jgi:hypothetical protein
MTTIVSTLVFVLAFPTLATAAPAWGGCARREAAGAAWIVTPPGPSAIGPQRPTMGLNGPPLS